jgi:hypothetical protein
MRSGFGRLSMATKEGQRLADLIGGMAELR